MHTSELQKAQERLLGFVAQFRERLARKDQSEQCRMYLSGLLLDGERKSIEPMAARLPGARRQSLHHFVCHSPWSSEDLQNQLWREMMDQLGVQKQDAGGSVLILDDTGLLKKGTHSVGVSRQYFGLQGQSQNCQVLVSWHYAHRPSGLHLPLRAELYLPTSWTDDRKRMERAAVPPDKSEFRTKWQIALDLLDQLREEVPHEALVFDAGYGCCKELLSELDTRGEQFVAAIPSTISFWPGDVVTHPSSREHNWRSLPPFQVVKNKHVKPMQAWQWYLFAKNKKTKQCRWHTIRLNDSQGTRVKATAIRVRERGAHELVPGAERWLIIERSMEDEVKYYVSSLPSDASLEKLVQLAHGRWPIEQGYQQLKEELGLDHYEGRSWPGFHHHVTLCLMAYDFLVLLQQGKAQKKVPQRTAA